MKSKMTKQDVQKWAAVAFDSVPSISKLGSSWTIKCIVLSPADRKVKMEIVGSGKSLEAAKIRCEQHFLEELAKVVDAQEKKKMNQAATVWAGGGVP